MYQVGTLLVFYPGLCVMSFWGVLAHSLVLCLIMQRWDGRNVALAAFLMAPFVPLCRLSWSSQDG